MIKQSEEDLSHKIVSADVFVFAGQSNMAGRGIVCEKYPEPIEKTVAGAGYEYKAITNPERLMPVDVTFGRDENTSWGINDGKMKTGSLVPSFINAYFSENGNIPVIGISASKGGSSVSMWQADSSERYLEDTLNRLESCRNYLIRRKIEIRHTFLLWCQGETDGDLNTTAEEYERLTRCTFDIFVKNGVEHIFMIQIGHYNSSDDPKRYSSIINRQKEMSLKYDDITLVSESFKTMRERGLMKDLFHYYQAAYNEVGREAGRNAAKSVRK